MNLLLSMSLAGSMVLLVYLVLRPLTVKYFSSAWRYRLLKLAILFYLLPYQYFKYIYYDIFCGIFFQRQYQSPEFTDGFGFYDMNRVILIDSEGNRSVKNGKVIFVVLAIWGIAVISYAIYQAAKYISCKRGLRQISTIPDPGFYKILDRCRKHARIKKKVELSCCSYISTPLTMGILAPHIILPDTLEEEESVEMAVSHELIHVKNCDILIKFLTLLVMVLHWYNPLTYFLYWEICRVHECVCDESVTQAMTEEEKERYKFLIVGLAQGHSREDALFASALSSNYNMIKERITLMDRSIISPKRMRIASIALAVVLLTMSPLPVLAYSPMVTGTSKNPDADADVNFDASHWMVFDQYAFYTLDIYDPLLESGTDYDIFVSESGITYGISKTMFQSERAFCIHSWQSGKIPLHYKNDDGSCVVNVYESQFCSKCGEYENVC